MSEYDWMEPKTEEDAVKQAIKRIDRLNKPGLLNDLFKMSKECHKALETGEGDPSEHLPMSFVRYEGSGPEDPQECFHICRKCISKYLMEHPETIDKITVLRGDVTEECKAFFAKRAAEKAKESAKSE